ncbi:MAG: CpsB/CapC family capsule biosynthesis tyrosine phosphatase, partial [Sodaliphilus sp.]|nr:CpsB/CapC family capsule biosynthesis tyrosine phosphatase [Sodaliphilus sp.]
MDHGAKNIQDGIELLKADMDMGIKRVILTPHVTSETFENTPETLNAAFAIFKEAVKEAGLDVELHLSAEYRIDDYWQKEYAAGHVIPMPGNYVLLE